MRYRINEKAVMITGAARGLGRELAALLDREGCRLVLVDRENMDAAAFQNARVYVCDLSDLPQRKSLIQEFNGKVDILINCAGIGSHSTLSQLGADEIERVLQVNTLAPLELIAGLSPLELVVNIGSVAGEMNLPSMSLYAASKSALHAFTHAIELEGTKTLLVILGPLRGTDFTRSIQHPRTGQPQWYRNLDLDAKVAADKIVQAMKHEKRQMVLPRWYRIVFGMARLSTPLIKIWLTGNRQY